MDAADSLTLVVDPAGSGKDKMKRILIAILLLILPSLCWAGGDYVSVVVTDISGKDGKYIIRIVQKDNRPELMENCKEMIVTVRYGRVPWFSWLPFVKSDHPSKEQTEEATEYLREIEQSNQAAYFGYMGYGLVPTDIKCSFKSRGLKIIDDKGIRIVFSYYDET